MSYLLIIAFYKAKDLCRLIRQVGSEQGVSVFSVDSNCGYIFEDICNETGRGIIKLIRCPVRVVYITPEKFSEKN